MNIHKYKNRIYKVSIGDILMINQRNNKPPVYKVLKYFLSLLKYKSSNGDKLTADYIMDKIDNGNEEEITTIENKCNNNTLTNDMEILRLIPVMVELYEDSKTLIVNDNKYELTNEEYEYIKNDPDTMLTDDELNLKTNVYVLYKVGVSKKDCLNSEIDRINSKYLVLNMPSIFLNTLCGFNGENMVSPILYKEGWLPVEFVDKIKQTDIAKVDSYKIKKFVHDLVNTYDIENRINYLPHDSVTINLIKRAWKVLPKETLLSYFPELTPVYDTITDMSVINIIVKDRNNSLTYNNVEGLFKQEQELIDRQIKKELSNN